MVRVNTFYGKITLLCFFLFLFSGCSLFTTSENRVFFDLGQPNSVDSKNIGLNVLVFSSDLRASTRMIFKNSNNMVQYDSVNNWAQTPQVLLSRYLALYFNNPDKPFTGVSNGISITGDIYSFQCDMDVPEALVVVDVVYKRNNSIIMRKVYRASYKMKELTALDFAKAMTSAVGDLANQMMNDILKLN